MATTGNARYLQYILLLGEGSLLVLRGIVNRELQNTGQSLSSFLQSNSTRLRILIQSDAQYERLFPPAGNVNTDLDTWDISLLTLIILRLFSSNLTRKERSAVRNIQSLRNSFIGHTSSLSFEETEYTINHSDLTAFLIKISQGLDRETHDKCQNIIKRSSSNSLDTTAVLHELRRMHEFDTEILTRIENCLTTAHAKLDVIAEEMKNTTKVPTFIGLPSSAELQELKRETIQIKSNTQEMKETTSQIENNTQELQRETSQIKCNIQEMKDTATQRKTDTQEINETTSQIKNDVQEMKETTSQIKNDAQEIQRENIKIKNHTQEMKETTLASLQETMKVRELLEVLMKKIPDCAVEQDVETKLNLRGDSEENISHAEETVVKYINDILKEVEYAGGQRKIDEDQLRHTVHSILKSKQECDYELCTALLELLLDILRQPGTYVLSAVKSCIILEIRCTSLQSLLKLLQYLESESFSQRLRQISDVIDVRMGISTSISAHVTQNSLRMISKQASNQVARASSKDIMLPIRCCSLEALEHTWTMFGEGTANHHFDRLSKALSRVVGGNIELTASLDSKGFKKGLSKMEIPVEFTDHLTDADVSEGDDITFTCEVDVLKKTATWFHDDKEIPHFSVRRSISSNGKKHSLTILNSKLYDDGKYRVAFGEVSSEAILTVKDTNSDLYKQRLTKQNYRNWMRGALSLLYLKQGLIGFTNKCMKKQHGDFLQKLPTSTVQCTHCNLETLMPFKNHANNKACHKRGCLCLKKPTPPSKRALCPNGGFCSKFYDLILAEHRHADLCLTNADIPAWISDPWSVGTCFVNTPGYKNKKSAQEIDCSGLLSVFVNDKFFNYELGDVRINGKSDLFKQARDATNDILHNPNYELSESELIRYIDLFKDVLEVRNATNKKPLENEPGVPKALQNLERLQTRQIDVEEEVNWLTKTIGDQEIADIFETAQKEMKEKVNTLEDILKEKEEQIKLLRQVRKCRPLHWWIEFKGVVFDLMIIVSGSTAEKVKIHNDNIWDTARHAIQSSDRRKPSISPLDLTMETETLVDLLVTLPDVKISLADDTVLILKISVTSCGGLNEFLTLMNGKILRQKLYQLRKCVEKEIEESVVVNARITSDSLSRAKIQLSTTDILNDKFVDFNCTSHPWMQDAWYCIFHDEFCCTTCKANEHRSCDDIKKVISGTTERKVEDSLLQMAEKKKYDVGVGGIFNRDDICHITGVCVLPDNEILLVDYSNNRLKKLNSSLELVSHCDLPVYPYDVCYIGNDVAVVSTVYCLQFVDVSSIMELKQTVLLPFPCRRLACHGDTLYVTDGYSVYTCKTDDTKPQLLYEGKGYKDIAVSDDGERIYLVCRNGSLVTTDNEGNHLSTLRTDELYNAGNVCTVGDGTVLLYDDYKKCVVQVDYEGKRVLGTVVPTTDSIERVLSMCFDRSHCRLIVGRYDYDEIVVFQLK